MEGKGLQDRYVQIIQGLSPLSWIHAQVDKAYWKHAIKLEQQQAVIEAEKLQQEAEYRDNCWEWATRQQQLGNEWRLAQFNQPRLLQERVQARQAELERQDQEAHEARKVELERQKQAETLFLQEQEAARKRKAEQDREERERLYDANQW